MKVKVLYSADDTTTEMIIEGHRVGVQVFADGRGVARVYNKKSKLRRTVVFTKVYLIDCVS